MRGLSPQIETPHPPRSAPFHKGRGKKKKAPVETGAAVYDSAEKRVLLVGAAILQRGAEDVAERRARIGGAILRDGFLLLGHFQRLDRHLDLAGLLVELDDAGIDLLADGEALRA